MSKDAKPLISILLPVFNNGYFLTDCLESILHQTYKNIEIIAIDDFSKDDSFKILQIYKRLDKRLRIYRNVKHYDKAITLNRALKRAKGHYIAFMDADDLMYRERLSQQVKFLQDNAKVVAIGTQCSFIDEHNKRLSKSEFPITNEHIYNKPLHGISIQFETVTINKYLLPKDLLKFETKKKTFLYSDIFMKLLAFGELANTPLPLQYHRKHSDKNPFTILKELPTLVKLWAKSFDQWEYRPKIRSFVAAWIKPQITTQ